MAIGVMHDLAVGVHPEGADAWALRDVLASGVAVGAPPDMYNQMGQDWSQPPWRPDALAEKAFLPYRDMLRTVLQHAGGIRIDHVLGLFRLWWIPRGMPANQGTYVRYDHEALVGILALEAQRAGCRRDRRGPRHGRGVGAGRRCATAASSARRSCGSRPTTPAIRCPGAVARAGLASVTTHDLPPTAGFLAGEHVAHPRRARAAGPPLRRGARRARGRPRALAGRAAAPRAAARRRRAARTTVEALHRYLARTPARLLGVSLADAVGDRRAQNQPGTDQEYPNWRVPLTDADGHARCCSTTCPGSRCCDGCVSALGG